MHIFKVDPREYYLTVLASEVEICLSPDFPWGREVHYPPDESRHHEVSRLLRVSQSMANVIDRYDLGRKSVLSVGSAEGREEFWFYKSGCTLTFLDKLQDDDGHDIGFESGVFKRLTQMAKNEDVREPLTFVVDDFRAFLTRSEWEERFDVVYFSSLAPDELRRERISVDYVNNRRPGDNRSWPRQAEPFLKEVLDYGRFLKPGGFFIVQSYRGGPCLTTNPHYIPQAVQQMKQHGLWVNELHYFTQGPGCYLIAATKGGPTDLGGRPPIKCFHGRYGDEGMARDVTRVPIHSTLTEKISAGWRALFSS